jgi:hypothetical protein
VAKVNKNMMAIGLIVAVVVIAGAVFFIGKSGGPLSSSAPYMSQDQAQSLFGAGGVYNYSVATNATAVSNLLGLMQAPSMFTNNVTAAWKVEYVNNTTHTSMLELILQMNNARAQSFYKQITNLSIQELSMDNATASGMVYSAKRLPDTAAIIGYKNSDLVFVLMNDSSINIQSVASVVASDMP